MSGIRPPGDREGFSADEDLSGPWGGQSFVISEVFVITGRAAREPAGDRQADGGGTYAAGGRLRHQRHLRHAPAHGLSARTPCGGAAATGEPVSLVAVRRWRAYLVAVCP